MTQMYRQFLTSLDNCKMYLMTPATMLSAAPRNRSCDHLLLCDAIGLEEVKTFVYESANGDA